MGGKKEHLTDITLNTSRKEKKCENGGTLEKKRYPTKYKKLNNPPPKLLLKKTDVIRKKHCGDRKHAKESKNKIHNRY